MLDFQDLYFDVVAVEGEGVGRPAGLLALVDMFVASRGGGLNSAEDDIA